MKILVTGGAGFIGSHTIIELQNAGHEPIAFDNLCNASPVVFDRIEAITGKSVEFAEGDIRDEKKLSEVFAAHDIDCVIHFAGLKAVGESVHKPIEYYDNNVGGTVKLLEAMRDAGCKNIIFSSSATVYGTPEKLPLTEDMPKGEVTNPYGRTKSIIEDILTDVQFAYPDMNVVLLRYFNPIGAHKSGTMGEDPTGIPNNLMPYITQVAVGKLDKLGVFGDDYDTPDGSGVRDYIHVMDLASGHVAALKALKPEGGLSSTTWARARARACPSWCTRLSRRRASTSPTRSSRAVRATSRRATPTAPRQSASSGGRHATTSRTCARTPGAGSA